MTETLYKTRLYEYFSEHIPDIFSAIEEQYVLSEQGENTIDIRVNIFSKNDLEDLYKTEHTLKSETYSSYLYEKNLKTGINEFDEWISKPILQVSKRKRYAFLKTILLCLENVVRIMTILFPALEEMEKVHNENGDEILYVVCVGLVDQYHSEGTLAPINDAETHDLAHLMYETVLQYAIGFELGLKRAKGRFSRKAKELLGIDVEDVDGTLGLLSASTEIPFDASTYEKGMRYEIECQSILEESGFQISLTKASGDQGADILCEKDGLSFSIQCKNTARVGNRAVQEVLSSQKHYATDFAVVVTPGEFTRAAKELAATTNVLLIKTDKLQNLMTLAV